MFILNIIADYVLQLFWPTHIVFFTCLCNIWFKNEKNWHYYGIFPNYVWHKEACLSGIQDKWWKHLIVIIACKVMSHPRVLAGQGGPKTQLHSLNILWKDLFFTSIIKCEIQSMCFCRTHKMSIQKRILVSLQNW